MMAQVLFFDIFFGKDLHLNAVEYAGIYLIIHSDEYARILNVPDAVHSIRSL